MSEYDTEYPEPVTGALILNEEDEMTKIGDFPGLQKIPKNFSNHLNGTTSG